MIVGAKKPKMGRDQRELMSQCADEGIWQHCLAYIAGLDRFDIKVESNVVGRRILWVKVV